MPEPNPPTNSETRHTPGAAGTPARSPAVAYFDRWAIVALFVAVYAIGIGLRLYFYLMNRPLWHDESMLALNIINRSIPELFQPLDYDQGAPVGFLILQNCLVNLFGSTEYVMRLIPLLAGLASMPLFHYLVRKLTSKPVALIALFLFAVSPQILYYSSELKQYSSDILITTLITLYGHRLLMRPNSSGGIYSFTALGAVSAWFSHPSLFVFTGAFLAIGINTLIDKDRNQFKQLFLAGLLYAVNIGVLYLANLKQAATNDYLIDFWREDFAPFPWDDLKWYGLAALKFTRSVLKIPEGYASVIVLAVSWVLFTLHYWRTSLLLTLPAAVTVVVSMFEKYPFGNRLILFLVPSAILMIAYTAHWLYSKLAVIHRLLAIAGLLLLLGYLTYPSFQYALQQLDRYNRREDSIALFEYLDKHHQDSDAIYVYYAADPAYRYYLDRYPISLAQTVYGTRNRDNPEVYLSELDQLDGLDRVWIFITHNYRSEGINEESYLIDHLNSLGKQLDRKTATGAALYLYDLSETDY